MSDTKVFILVILLVAMVASIITVGVLAGQYLRNERAASMVPGDFIVNLTAPDGYNCEADWDSETGQGVVSIRCSPK